MAIDTFYSKLAGTLDDIVKVYRQLLELVRQEYEFLKAAEINQLQKVNETKEALLIKMRSLETIRSRQARELGKVLGLEEEVPTLNDLARKLDSVQGDRLRSIRSVLDLLIQRLSEHNKQNEILAQSGLRQISGALGAIRETLRDRPVYQRKGEISAPSVASGQLVSREV